MTRVVLDANVLAPAFVNPAATAGSLVTLWRAGAFELIVSVPILAELRRTYQDPYYARRVTPDLLEAVLTLLAAEATVVELTVRVSGIATHPEDDLVLSAAASSAAEFLGTRDRQLLKLGTFQGTRILHPTDLAPLLKGTNQPDDESITQAIETVGTEKAATEELKGDEDSPTSPARSS